MDTYFIFLYILIFYLDFLYISCSFKSYLQADEAYPVDQENQGNTLVSVAPLNPPPETPEKPSVNGESPEAVKTEPTPPTNGHSTTNTADTEMWNSSQSTHTKLSLSFPSSLPQWHMPIIHTLSYTHRCLFKVPPPLGIFHSGHQGLKILLHRSSCCHSPRSSFFGYKYQEYWCEGQWWMTAMTETPQGCWWLPGWEWGAGGGTVGVGSESISALISCGSHHNCNL